MNRPHALYRFFDRDGVLLYVGITLDPGARWKQHREDKPWWVDVHKVTLEVHPDRETVLAAERAAILVEQPRHNVVHNRDRKRTTEPQPAGLRVATRGPYDSSINLWSYRNKRSNYETISDLYLAWEVNGTAMSDDYEVDEVSAIELLQLWAKRYAKRRHVPIYWSIWPAQETAPFQTGFDSIDEDFLSHFTWPINQHTGDWVNFNRLPVIDGEWSPVGRTKGGFFQAATGWRPAPLQGHVDLKAVFDAAGISTRHIEEHR